jgi:hypothetical protein
MSGTTGAIGSHHPYHSWPAPLCSDGLNWKSRPGGPVFAAGRPMTKTDTSEYSSSKAPETREHAEERQGNRVDARLMPGGAHGSSQPQGIDALDREAVPNGAADTGLTQAGDSPGKRAQLNNG